MVLVRHEIAVRAKAPQNHSDSNASPAQKSLSGGVHEAAFQVAPQPVVDSTAGPGDRMIFHAGSYQTQLQLLEQQNKSRLLAMRKAQHDRQQVEELKQRGNINGLEESTSSSREGYHLQQMALERENGKKSMGNRPHLPTLGSGSRNQGHDAQATGGIFRTQGQISQLAQLKMLEEEDEKRNAYTRDGDANPKPTRRDESVWDGVNISDPEENQMQWKELETTKESCRNLRRNTLVKSAPKDIPTTKQDRWGMGLFQADQGTTSGYEAEVMALEKRRREEIATGSQTEVEFGQQRQRYLTEEAEMSRFSGQNLPGALGSSCSPPDISLALRAVPRPDVEFDDLYDN
ncbi:hypothetical protein VTL71DRAFT_4393 [Oculimacula yallundae]|uniref:Uncharacterized protein n=1 Tax=Oculimacula yallundae TaxID=86028 RepID=A0ABR4C1X5_9HELO